MLAAVVEKIGKVTCKGVPSPEPNKYQALVEITCGATCNSTDYRIVHGNLPWKMDYPCILGHESVGRIVSLGSKVKNFEVGELVLRPTSVYPGEKLDGYYSGWGGFAEYGLVTDVEAMIDDGVNKLSINPYAFLHQKVPSNISPADAVVIITLRETMSWVEALGVSFNSSVLIMGDGPVGLAFVQCAKIRGANPIIIVGHRDERLNLACIIGANYTINSHGVGFVNEVKNIVGSEGVDFLIDCTGDQSTLNAALNLVKPSGKIAAYGTPKVPPTGPAPNDSRIMRIKTDEPGAHNEIVSLILDGRINPKLFYSESLPLSRISEAIERIGGKKALAKIIIDVGEER
jgi:threonine dehydrogenase-like Zn-dependent dehydrogenase